MNEFTCNDCGEVSATNEAELKECQSCGSDMLQQSCPMCGSIIDPDTKVCPECREAV